MTRQRNFVVVWAAMVLAGCSAAKPARQWAPAYPSMLRSAGYAGTTTVMVRVDRSGHPRVVPRGPSSVIGQHPLFLRAVGQAVTATTWHPARRFGFPHADSALYQVDFVILRDTSPLGPNELRGEGNDTLPRACPRPRTPHHVVVCSTADHVRYRVLH
jgi:hypothetical protein